MKIYTKSGDTGKTSLFGGKRVRKNNLRIECYGTIDELNAAIGVAAAETEHSDIKQKLIRIQNYLFDAGSDLAAPIDASKVHGSIPRIDRSYIEELELMIDEMEEKLDPLKSFILPGGSKCSAFLHLARTICRRAERNITSLSEIENIGTDILIFTNRLSDLLFVFARSANKAEDLSDISWKKKK